MEKIKVGEIYKHFKGNTYKILAIAKHSETMEDLIIYQQIDKPQNIWARPNSMFLDVIEKDRTLKKLLYSSDAFKAVFDKVAYDVAGIQFQHQTYMFDACMLVVDTLLQVLDREAKEGETVDIELPGYFKASVAIEDGEKVFAVTPDGHMKQIIKDDAEVAKL